MGNDCNYTINSLSIDYRIPPFCGKTNNSDNLSILFSVQKD